MLIIMAHKEYIILNGHITTALKYKITIYLQPILHPMICTIDWNNDNNTMLNNAFIKICIKKKILVYKNNLNPIDKKYLWIHNKGDNVLINIHTLIKREIDIVSNNYNMIIKYRFETLDYYLLRNKLLNIASYYDCALI